MSLEPDRCEFCGNETLVLVKDHMIEYFQCTVCDFVYLVEYEIELEFDDDE
jgi:transcription elongation factor Elf1